MMFKKVLCLSILVIFLLPAFGQSTKKKIKKSKNEYVFTLTSSLGTIVFVLYDETPKHKANFLKLVKQKFYDDLLFHRVINNFMIQGGDPNSKNAKPEVMLGNGDVGYKVDAEFNPKLFHKKGAIAAARDGNPQKASSGCQFYIVQGRKFPDENVLAGFETNNNFKYTEEQKRIYKEIGGTPHLDQNYTVFGEVIKGIEVLDAIAKTPTGTADRPKTDVKMKIMVQKISKKKIEKMYGYKF